MAQRCLCTLRKQLGLATAWDVGVLWPRARHECECGLKAHSLTRDRGPALHRKLAQLPGRADTLTEACAASPEHRRGVHPPASSYLVSACLFSSLLFSALAHRGGAAAEQSGAARGSARSTTTSPFASDCECCTLGRQRWLHSGTAWSCTHGRIRQ